MKRNSTILLKVAVFIGSPILTLFIFLLPWVISGLAEVIPVPPYLQYLGFMGLYGAVVPFLFALYQAIKFLGYVNKQEACSELSVKALENIKYSGITISVLYVIAMPLIFLMADADDAPGAILFGLFVIFVSGVSALFASGFERRCHSNKIS